MKITFRVFPGGYDHGYKSVEAWENIYLKGPLGPGLLMSHLVDNLHSCCERDGIDCGFRPSV